MPLPHGEPHAIAGWDRLTESSLIYLFSRESKDGQQVGHYLYCHFSHRRRRWDLDIDFKAPEEALDAFKQIDKGVVTCTDILGCLEDPDIIKNRQGVEKEIRTLSRTPMPEKTAFAGGNS
jgi:hypothetical protein